MDRRAPIRRSVDLSRVRRSRVRGLRRHGRDRGSRPPVGWRIAVSGWKIRTYRVFSPKTCSLKIPISPLVSSTYR